MVDYDKNGSIDELEVLRWNDENRAGKGDFQMWTKAKHPHFGEVEVGGFNPKFYGQNPPLGTTFEVIDELRIPPHGMGAAVADDKARLPLRVR